PTAHVAPWSVTPHRRLCSRGSEPWHEYATIMPPTGGIAPNSLPAWLRPTRMRTTLDATATPGELMEADDATPPATTNVDPVDAMKQAVLDGDTRNMSRTLLRSSGPRLLRDILGPTLSFYAGWKVTGSLLVGVVLGTTFSFAAYRYERHHGRPG